MLVNFKGLIEIEKKEWQLKFVAKGSPEVINLSPWQIHYVTKAQAWCQIAISEKGKFFYINGLISFGKRHGQHLIRSAMETFDGFECRINCLGDVLKDKYVHYGFEVTYSCESHLGDTTYYEMVCRKPEDFISEYLCENCTRYYEGKCLLQGSKPVEWNYHCDMFYSAVFSDDHFFRRY